MSKSRRSVVRRSSEPGNIGRPLATPFSPSVAYHYSDVDQLNSVYEKQFEGFTYARYGNPNSAILAEKISWMEDAQGGVMTASGMSALSAVFMGILNAGDGIAAATQLYGQSLKLTSRVLPRLGFKTTFFDASDPGTFADAIKPSTKIVLAEIVSNPMLRVTDFLALVPKYKHIAYPLVNNKDVPIGWITLEEAAKVEKQFRCTTSVKKIAIRKLITVYPDETALTAFKKMSSHKIGRVLVIDRNDSEKILGIVTKTDLIHALTKQF